jgi:DnaJ-class molecular chaperone
MIEIIEQPCATCEGEGRVEYGRLLYPVFTECSACEGTGKILMVQNTVQQ